MRRVDGKGITGQGARGRKRERGKKRERGGDAGEKTVANHETNGEVPTEACSDGEFMRTAATRSGDEKWRENADTFELRERESRQALQ